MKKLILLLILILVSSICFAQAFQETGTTSELFNDQNSAISDGPQMQEVKDTLIILRMILSHFKDSGITNQLSDILTDLYAQMYKDLVKKGFTQKEAFALMTMTFEQAEKVVQSIQTK